MSKAKTVAVAREEFLDHLRSLVHHWSTQSPLHTKEEACNGLVFSILVVFDGGSSEFPNFDLILRPHPSDKDFCINNNEDWYEDGMVINDVSLHEIWYKK